MMTLKNICLGLMIVAATATSAYAIKGVMATEQDIARLKEDLIAGKINVGRSRLNDIRNAYGEAVNITTTTSKITYDYGDLRVDFDRDRYWRDWEYDSFKKRAYTNDIDTLRDDLEAEAIVGDNVSLQSIIRDYGQPTESHETTEDGATSVYYYGDIKLEFENVYRVSSWKGKNLGKPNKPAALESK